MNINDGMSYAKILKKPQGSYILTDSKNDFKKSIIIGSVHTAKSRDIDTDVSLERGYKW